MRGAKSAFLGRELCGGSFPLSCRTQTGGSLPFNAPQVKHLFKRAISRVLSTKLMLAWKMLLVGVGEAYRRYSRAER